MVVLKGTSTALNMFSHSLKVPDSDDIFLGARVLLLLLLLVLSSTRTFAVSVSLYLLPLLESVESGGANCTISVVAVGFGSIGQPCCYRVCVGFVLLANAHISRRENFELLWLYLLNLLIFDVDVDGRLLRRGQPRCCNEGWLVRQGT